MPPPSSSSRSTNSSNLWHLSYTKLRFFTRIRRFLQSKTNPKGPNPNPKPSPPDPNGSSLVINIISDSDHHRQLVDSCSEVLTLQRAVKQLHFGCPKEKEMAATEIQRLAKHDLKVKKLMAELGVIPPLVAMAAAPSLSEPEAVGRRLAAVTALLELATGTYTNKALMVEAGILEKLPNKIDESVDEATRHVFSELVLSLSSLNNCHVSLNPSSHLLPFTLAILDSDDTKPDTKESCLGTLFNLSTALHNAANLASHADTVDSLLRVVVSSNQDNNSKALCEKALATLGNIIVTLPGKKSVENSESVPHGLIEVLTWDDFPKAQELAAYVLMVLAHQSWGQRAKMAAAGIVPVLLQVALLGGSALAQKRAMKLLQWFKDERRMTSHSGPQTRIGSPLMMAGQNGKNNKRVMQRLVKDSLEKNMEMITKRAAAVEAHGSSSSSNLKSLVISTSSKSLPY